MAFGLNRAELIGRLGADVAINHLASGGRVANLSIATDEGYVDKQSGERVEKTEWHRVVTFQNGLIDMLDKNAKKGRLVYVAGKMQTRRWKKEARTPSGSRPRSSWCPAGACSSSTRATARTGPPLRCRTPRRLTPAARRTRTYRSRKASSSPSLHLGSVLVAGPFFLFPASSPHPPARRARASRRAPALRRRKEAAPAGSGAARPL